MTDEVLNGNNPSGDARLLCDLEASEYDRVSDLASAVTLYACFGVPMGGFMMAVLRNDLRAACNRADMFNRSRLFAIVFTLYNTIPSGAWGSPNAVASWMEARSKDPLDPRRVRWPQSWCGAAEEAVRIYDAKKKKKWVFITGCVDGEHEFEVHRDGCTDVPRKATDPGAGSYIVEAESAEEAVAREAAEFQSQEQDWFADRDFRVMPCCR